MEQPVGEGRGDAALVARPHTRAFAQAWREVVCGVFRWKRAGECVRVPGLFSGATLSYLPLLNYTDLTLEEGRALAASLDRGDHLVRVLDPAREGDPREGEPVALRLPLAGRSREEVWTQLLGSKCRNQVRKSENGALIVRRGSEPALLADFYRLLARTSHGYGAPVFPARLFRELAERLAARVYVAYAGDRPAAGIFVLEDAGLVWVPWAASDREHLSLCPNHAVYWKAIEDALEGGREVFCFGRSPCGGATFKFKRQWGASAVPIALLARGEVDVYDKYRRAQELWRRAPRVVVDVVGPRLCRYLADY